MSRMGRRAFTLLELLVVLGILALLATLVAPRVLSRLQEAKPVQTRQQIANADTALASFRLDVGRYPTTQEGLESLITRPSDIEESKWKGPYLARKAMPRDGWGNELLYRKPGKEEGMEYEVYSLGADGEEGGEGENADIFQWSE